MLHHVGQLARALHIHSWGLDGHNDGVDVRCTFSEVKWQSSVVTTPPTTHAFWRRGNEQPTSSPAPPPCGNWMSSPCPFHTTGSAAASLAEIAPKSEERVKWRRSVVSAELLALASARGTRSGAP